jgi:cbb3-type cytochrome oxidase maturation protein
LTKIILAPCRRLYLALKLNATQDMKIIILLIILSLIVALGFLSAFFWAVRDGQFDDDVSPAMRILFDDDQPDNNKNTTTTKS